MVVGSRVPAGDDAMSVVASGTLHTEALAPAHAVVVTAVNTGGCVLEPSENVLRHI